MSWYHAHQATKEIKEATEETVDDETPDDNTEDENDKPALTSATHMSK